MPVECFVRGCSAHREAVNKSRRAVAKRKRLAKFEAIPCSQTAEPDHAAIISNTSDDAVLSVDKPPMFGEDATNSYRPTKHRFEEWRRHIPRKPGKFLRMCDRVCFRHFEPECFNFHYIVKDGKKLYTKNLNRKVTLKRDAIPTIFPNKRVKLRKPPRDRSKIQPPPPKPRKKKTDSQNQGVEAAKNKTEKSRPHTPAPEDDVDIEIEFEIVSDAGSDGPGPPLFDADDDFDHGSSPVEERDHGTDDALNHLLDDSEDDILPLTRFMTHAEILKCVKDKTLHLPSPTWNVSFDEEKKIICIHHTDFSEHLEAKMDIAVIFKENAQSVLRVNGHVRDSLMHFISIESLNNYLLKLSRRRTCAGVGPNYYSRVHHIKCSSFLIGNHANNRCPFCQHLTDPNLPIGRNVIRPHISFGDMAPR